MLVTWLGEKEGGRKKDQPAETKSDNNKITSPGQTPNIIELLNAVQSFVFHLLRDFYMLKAK